jgi:hypothetical protein
MAHLADQESPFPLPSFLVRKQASSVVEDYQEASEKTLEVSQRDAAAKFTKAVVLLMGSVCLTGAIMSYIELPFEKERVQAQSNSHRKMRFALFYMLFNFVVTRDLQMTLRLTEDEIKFSSCAAIHTTNLTDRMRDSPAFDIYNQIWQDTQPQLDDSDSMPHIYWDMEKNTLSETCVLQNKDGYIDDAWDAQDPHLWGYIPATNQKGCYLLCPLVLPTVSQVEACRVNDSAHFRPKCLSNTPDCPNCNLLRPFPTVQSIPLTNPMIRRVFKDAGANSSDIPEGRVFGLRDPGSEALLMALDPTGNNAIFAADVYLTYKRAFDESLPNEVHQWDFRGSVFFATTLLATIGYGNYCPTQDWTKAMIVATSLPTICLFGYALTQVATLIMKLTSRLEHLLLGFTYKDQGLDFTKVGYTKGCTHDA